MTTSFDEKKTATSELRPKAFPRKCVDEADGLLGDITGWINGCARRPQPELTLFHTMTALGALYGRRYESPTGLRTNLYTVGIAGTSSGKDHSRKRIKALFMEAGLKDLLMGDRVMSGQAILTALSHGESKIAHYDEFGLMMKSVNQKGAASHLNNIIPTMLELYSSSGSIYNGNEYADVRIKRQDLYDPCLCIYGTTTPETFWPALSSIDTVSGLLNRMIVVPTQDEYPVPREAASTDVPVELAQNVSDSYAICDEAAGNLAAFAKGIMPTTIKVKETAEVTAAVLALEEWQLDRLREGKPLSQLWGRFTENVIKLAMISAISFNPEKPVITIERFNWAQELVEWTILNMIHEVEYNVADSQHEQDINFVRSKIREAGPSGLTRSQLTKKIQKLNPPRRNGALADLIEMGQVKVDEEKTTTKPTTRFTLSKFLK